MRFYIIDDKPYLIGCDGKIYTCSLGDGTITLGADVEIASAPDVSFSEIEVRAKLSVLDSIKKSAPKKEVAPKEEVKSEEKPKRTRRKVEKTEE